MDQICIRVQTNVSELIVAHIRALRGLDTLGTRFAIFYKGDNFTEFLFTVNVLKFHTHKCLTKWHYANSAEPDQSAPKEQSDQGLHCLPFH